MLDPFIAGIQFAVRTVTETHQLVDQAERNAMHQGQDRSDGQRVEAGPRQRVERHMGTRRVVGGKGGKEILVEPVIEGTESGVQVIVEEIQFRSRPACQVQATVATSRQRWVVTRMPPAIPSDGRLIVQAARSIGQGPGRRR